MREKGYSIIVLILILAIALSLGVFISKNVHVCNKGNLWNGVECVGTGVLISEQIIKQDDIVIKDAPDNWKTVEILGLQFSYPASLEFSQSHIDDTSVTFTLSPEKEANPNLIFEITLRKVKDRSVDLKTQLNDQIEASIKSGYTSSASTPVAAKLGAISAYKYSQIVNSFESLNYAARNKDLDLHVSTGLYQGRQTAEDLEIAQKIISSFRLSN